MRNIILTSLVVLIITGGAARANPFFGDRRHQVAANISMGVESSFIAPPPFRIVPFNEFHLQYSVPTTLFYFPARFSFNVSQMVGYGKKYGWDWRDFTIPALYLTEDVILFHGNKWYTGAGAGAGFQIRKNDRIGSTLIFVFKVFAGYKINDAFAVELYTKHFSNGNTTPENYSYGFWGVGATYNF